MKIEQVMTKNPEYLAPDTTVAEAARKMGELDVGLLPVGDGTRLNGMLTDRDIALRVTAQGHDPDKTTVSEVMTPEIVYVFEDQDIEEAVKTMESHQIRRLIVLDRDKQMTGIVALGDLATRAESAKPAASALAGVSS